MTDLKVLAATAGISSRVLADMIRPDGSGLMPHADPRVVERVGQHLVLQGYTPSQVRVCCVPYGPARCIQ